MTNKLFSTPKQMQSTYVDNIEIMSIVLFCNSIFVNSVNYIFILIIYKI